jgi:uncharacterized protein (TIGR02147 family)
MALKGMGSISIFDYEDFTEFLRLEVKRRAGEERGANRRLSDETGIHPSTFSQILNGQRVPSIEQCARICDYLELSDAASEYFLGLVQLSQTQLPRLSRILKSRLDSIRKSEVTLHKKMVTDYRSSEQMATRFYSTWQESAVWVLSSIPEFENSELIRKHLRISRQRFEKIVQFLVSSGLCVNTAKGIKPGPKFIHLDPTSDAIFRHHCNWRIRAIQRHPQMMVDEELAGTFTLSLSQKDAVLVRKKCVEFIESVTKITDPSDPECAYVLNLDWLKI